MIFSRAWLSRYLALEVSDRELGDTLTRIGFAVDGIEKRGEDTLFDLDITTNRPDCMCYLGLARELALALDLTLETPPVKLETAQTTSEMPPPTIDPGAAEDCVSYCATVIEGVKIAPSPAWLADALRSIGLRPINNVVDVTNFVLWETGQPLHAFDLDHLQGPAIGVRRAREGEKLQTLDGEEREVDPEILVIADSERAVALAGVMGGAATEVTESTVAVLLESAHFAPSAVRRSSRRLGIRTDASHRFERGADPAICVEAARRAAALILEVAGGKAGDAVEVRSPVQLPKLEGRLEIGRLNAFAGLEIAAGDVERILGGLGFGLEALADGVWEVTVPSWRHYDFSAVRSDGSVFEADIFEEILRHVGFDRIPATLLRVAGPDAPSSEEFTRRWVVQDHLAVCGFLEAVHYAFHAHDEDRAMSSLLSGEAVELLNPMSDRQGVLRRSLIPGLLASARSNQNREAAGVSLFEVGHVFCVGGDSGVVETETAAIVAGGQFGEEWDGQAATDLFSVKGAVESLAAVFDSELTSEPAELRGFISGTAAKLHVGGAEGPVVGQLGQLDDPELRFPLFAAEILTSALASNERPAGVALPSRYPSITADLTLVHSLSVRWEEISGAIEDLRSPELVSYLLVVRYRGEGVPSGAVATTVRFVYQSSERSLSQDEVNERQGRLVAELERRFGFEQGGRDGKEDE